MEFFLGIFLAFQPDGVVLFDTSTFPTYDTCVTASLEVEVRMAARLPEGTEIRISCISTESIGQNSV